MTLSVTVKVKELLRGEDYPSRPEWPHGYLLFPDQTVAIGRAKVDVLSDPFAEREWIHLGGLKGSGFQTKHLAFIASHQATVWNYRGTHPETGAEGEYFGIYNARAAITDAEGNKRESQFVVRVGTNGAQRDHVLSSEGSLILTPEGEATLWFDQTHNNLIYGMAVKFTWRPIDAQLVGRFAPRLGRG